MRVLKSGIEVDNTKKSKIKGGACCCFCQYGWSSSGITFPGTVGDICLCHCLAPPDEGPELLMSTEMNYDKYRY